MTVAVVSIGDEILMGSTINTNAAYISKQLTQLGYKVAKHIVLPDSKEEMKKGIINAFCLYDIVIVTGGLGPTCDDFTRDVLADIFKSKLVRNEEIAKTLKERYGNLPISLEDQCLVIENAAIIPNPSGTASGFKFHQNTKLLFALPGVPFELQQMFQDVLRSLKEEGPIPENFIYTMNLCNLPESAVDPTLRELEKKYPHIKIGIYASYGLLNVKFEIQAVSAVKARQKLAPLIQTIQQKFGYHLFDAVHGKIDEAIHQIFSNNPWTLSLAESCTGGGIASRLTRYPGSSKYFLGSVVSYSNLLKQELLKVSPKTLEKYGAVSEQTVLEMVTGIQNLTGSTYALAVSGIAGPDGGTPEKPVGTVWGAIIKERHAPKAWKFKAFGNREMIIERSINALLSQLWLEVRES